MLPPLEKVLAYKNPHVLKLYNQNYPNNKLSAEDAFEEALKYIWLTQKHKEDQINFPEDETIPHRCVMLRSMQEIDEMWHEFILFTEDYTQFCLEHFGEYVHHMPNLFDTMPISEEEMNAEINKLLPYIYDHLGEKTMRNWFMMYL